MRSHLSTILRSRNIDCGAGNPGGDGRATRPTRIRLLGSPVAPRERGRPRRPPGPGRFAGGLPPTVASIAPRHNLVASTTLVAVDLERVRQLRDDYEVRLDDADAARAAYHEAIRDVYLSGVPLREIAQQLGISHQRVHQIVGVKQPSEQKSHRRIIGAAGAAGLLVAVLVMALILRNASPRDDSAARPVTIEVLTQGSSWRFDYPNQAVTVSGPSPELVLPEGRPISFTATSADVIHAFWVPRLGQKQDIIPGRANTFVLTAPSGIYEGTDAEFAGLDYELPEFRVRVVPQTEFEQWLAHQAATSS